MTKNSKFETIIRKEEFYEFYRIYIVNMIMIKKIVCDCRRYI
jgi:hypothetical protein